MNNPNLRHSPAWIVFAYVSFAAAVAMLVVGIVLMPIDLAMKGYLAMGIAMLVQSCITLTKTIRDSDEAGKLVNRIEDARTERLLMDVARGQT
ncbi:MAG TPA: YiaA/YiaB family inner membrane protein [Stellaceae bacterium]|nr:YiaA/YiaB family inner membrane protein [Stellaceae bacterium]